MQRYYLILRMYAYHITQEGCRVKLFWHTYSCHSAAPFRDDIRLRMIGCGKHARFLLELAVRACGTCIDPVVVDVLCYFKIAVKFLHARNIAAVVRLAIPLRL